MKHITEKYRGRRVAKGRGNWRNQPPSVRRSEIASWREAGDKVKFMALKFVKGNKRLARKIIGGMR